MARIPVPLTDKLRMYIWSGREGIWEMNSFVIVSVYLFGQGYGVQKPLLWYMLLPCLGDTDCCGIHISHHHSSGSTFYVLLHLSFNWQ